MTQSTEQAPRISDDLVSLRQFVGVVGAVVRDQTYMDDDIWIGNPTGRFQTVGPNGRVSIEGQPTLALAAGPHGLSISPLMTLALLGVGAWLLLRR